MTRQTLLGWLFIVIGLALLALVCAPVVAAIHAHAVAPAPSQVLIITSLVTALFGAWLIPSSGVGPTTVNFLGVVGPYIPFGRRANSGEQTMKSIELPPPETKP